ncbi:hypothetical protein Kpol_1001p11 [Vanderwaltozyma polyspora DSM 70294]|uniref:Origin recognition complex subunit 1 n=1 Tax=Vanderwaltozyma polyspora (strain ATCC 22028 / DSM 70294 / BCRC 21397 / CBS 2163 / NBRC 10782 / NRRL Y-8283 / UCD 57-17) TaxID=436907 RepID=A7TNP8_VANPO|nr:uncharacterized protein Kpol_1001p11 [Vanderwaltozyma polyspora DSM 70294]EDO16099.1 hypothetical protein Kpol_1001p11 [Vanderwaltozyma polyspora DSM 70294]
MAHSQKDLAGWKIVITDAENNVLDGSKRRSRRNAPKEYIHLERESDELRFTRGDSIIMYDEKVDSNIVYLVNEIRLNTMNNVVEILGMLYLGHDDLDPIKYLEQFDPDFVNDDRSDEEYVARIEQDVGKKRLFLTASLSEIWLMNFRGMANILEEEEAKDLTDKIEGKDFVVNYVCDPDSTNFVSIEFKGVRNKILECEPKEAEEFLKKVSLPKVNTNTIKSQEKEPKKIAKSMKSRKSVVEDIKLESESENNLASSSSDEEQDNSSDYANDNGNHISTDEEDIDNEEEGSGNDDNNDNISIDTDEEEYGRKNKRKRRTTQTTSVKAPRTKRKATSTVVDDNPRSGTPKTTSNQQNGLFIRKFTKRNVARAKKKYTPFSKRFKSIKDIPDLTKLAEFNQASADLEIARLEDKLRAPKGQKVVETIFSKVKKRLYSSHGREEIMKSTNFNDYLPGRENEFASIYLSLYSAVESGSATTVYVAGTPGVGKTLTVREVINEMQNSVDNGELPKFQYVELNGLKMVKPTDSYEVLWNKVSGERLTWGAAMESLEFYFNKVPREKKGIVVVLLDELDALVTKAQDIMYNFFNWTTYENAKLIVVAVANTMDLPERQLGNKVSSRIGFTRIMFAGYTHDELKNIINCKLQGLNDSYFYVNSKNGSAHLINPEEESSIDDENLPKHIKKVQLRMSDDAIEIAARKVASVSGDARRALKICKRAAEIAEQYYMSRHGYGYDGLPLEEIDDFDMENDEDVIALRKERANNKALEMTERDNDDSIQTVHISHIVKALNETVNSRTVKVIERLPFTVKLFLYALLNLMKKTMKQEQHLGDIIDEIKLLVDVNGKNKFIVEISKTLFGQDSSPNEPSQLRMVSWNFVLNQLIDSGIIIRQTLKNERKSTVKLNISTEDIKNAIEREDSLKGL